MEIFKHTDEILCFEDNNVFCHLDLTSHITIKIVSESLIINDTKIKYFSYSKSKKRYELITRLIVQGPKKDKRKEI